MMAELSQSSKIMPNYVFVDTAFGYTGRRKNCQGLLCGSYILFIVAVWSGLVLQKRTMELLSS